MLLMLGSYTDQMSKLKDIFKFISISKTEENAALDKAAIYIDHSYSDYTKTIALFPHKINFKKCFLPIKTVIKPSDYIIFPKGHNAGHIAKISDLLYNKNHCFYDDFSETKIVPASNTIIIQAKDNISIIEGYHDLLVMALFFVNLIESNEYEVNDHHHVYYEQTFARSLHFYDFNETPSHNQKSQYSLNIKVMEDIMISLPSIEQQEEHVRRYKQEIDNHYRKILNAKSIKDNKQEKTNIFDFIMEIQKSLTPFTNASKKV